MLQDRFLPNYNFSEKHSIIVNQSPEKIYALVDNLDFSGSWVIKILFKLRGMTTRMTMKEGLLRQRFIMLAQIENEEILLGLAGQFWKPDGNLQKLTPDGFVTFQARGFLKATWGFTLTKLTGNKTTVGTETRIQCLDEVAYRKFRRYWFVIRPFSGLIRKEILRSIRKKAEADLIH
jgi:hypothetical protein